MSPKITKELNQLSDHHLLTEQKYRVRKEAFLHRTPQRKLITGSAEKSSKSAMERKFQETILYVSQNSIIARFAAFERNKLHQILKIVSISPKRLTYVFLSFFVQSFPRFFNDFKFRWLFLYSKRNVPLVSTVPHFCVPIDHKRT